MRVMHVPCCFEAKLTPPPHTQGLVDAKVINQDYMSSANWSDNAGWELLGYMARHVAKLELARVRDAAFFAVSGDEATSRDKLSYFSLTAYIMVSGAADDDARRRTVEANFKAAFSRRVALVEQHFGTSKTREVRKEGGEVEVHSVPARIDMKELRAESAPFKALAMQHSNSREWAEASGGKASGVTTMWRLIDKKSDGSSGRAHQLFPTWARLAEMSIVLAPTSVEDERTFSGLNYIKNDQRSRLGSGNSHDHLVWAMRMLISRLFTLDTFPYAAVIKEWREKRRVI
jgi:hypothetical protein